MGKAQQQTGERQATRSLIAKTIVKKSLPKAMIARIKDAVLEKWRLIKLLCENEQLMLQLTSAYPRPVQVDARLQRALTSHLCPLTR